MEKLAQQYISIRKDQTLKVQLLAAGEATAIIHAYNDQIELAQRLFDVPNAFAQHDNTLCIT